MCAFEFRGSGGGPRHLHHDQDEWIYVIDGECEFEVGEKRFHAGSGESVFIPRKVSHTWARVSDEPTRIINLYQPAGKMEEFFRELGKYVKPQIHDVLTIDEFRRLFHDHGMDLLGPPLVGKWKVEKDGRVRQIG
jgi:uncharacterized cupin superfamily protein